jgi:hypothetical protein
LCHLLQNELIAASSNDWFGCSFETYRHPIVFARTLAERETLQIENSAALHAVEAQQMSSGHLLIETDTNSFEVLPSSGGGGRLLS